MKVSGKILALPDAHPANLDRSPPPPWPQDPDIEEGKPWPRPASKTHTCCLGSGFARLCIGAGCSSRSRGSPVRSPLPPAPSRLCRSLGSSAHRARGRACAASLQQLAGRRLRPCLTRFTRECLRWRLGCLGNRGLGWSDWRREPGRGRRLRRQQGSNTARPRHGVGEGVARPSQGARVCSCGEKGFTKRRCEVKADGRPGEATSAEAQRVPLGFPTVAGKEASSGFGAGLCSLQSSSPVFP